ncbi:MAG: acyltransferase, partial [Saprospiraceae bacterium]|nr:acyltransferase [Saprospiraceae bacterium]
MKERLEYPDFARAYAILSIALFHALQRLDLPGFWGEAIVFGGSGVHLFFLLSGFGLGLSAGPYFLTTFYRRRFFKIWLPYVLALSLSLLFAATLDWFPDGMQAWLAGVALYQMFVEKYIEAFGGHFWFISTILQFYLIFPLLRFFKIKIKNDVVFLGAALILSITWWCLVYGLGKGELRTWNSFFLQFLWEFALGMVLAERYRNGKSFGAFWQFPVWMYLFAGVFFSALMVWMVHSWGDAGKIFNDIPAMIGYTALSLLVYRMVVILSPPLLRLFLWIGGFSFSIYLVHILVLELCERTMPPIAATV